jgi:hypothetical protein
MHFDKEQWERIKLFADAFNVTPQHFVESCVDVVCHAHLQVQGPEIIQRGLDKRSDRRRAHTQKREARAEAQKLPGAKGKLTHNLADKLQAALQSSKQDSKE